jgi:hypothetical protein
MIIAISSRPGTDNVVARGGKAAGCVKIRLRIWSFLSWAVKNSRKRRVALGFGVNRRVGWRLGKGDFGGVPWKKNDNYEVVSARARSGGLSDLVTW